jgi:quercetin dioxygenase-like cupin family protein
MSGRLPVKKAGEIPTEPVAGGVGTIRQVLIGPEEGPHFALRRFTIAPGGGMPRHTNTVEHEQYVLAGRATVTVGDQIFAVQAHDVVFIPAGVAHGYRTEGDGPFVFLCAVPNNPDEIRIVE